MVIPVPLYQNLLNLFFTLLFMVLYTISVNTPNDKGRIDFVEGTLFAFALGFFFDEVAKMYSPLTLDVDNRYNGGLVMIGFWNAYNVRQHTSYTNPSYLSIPFSQAVSYFESSIISTTIEIRTHEPDDRILSYDLLACLAPFLCILHLEVSDE